jgi:hypothetical protein
MEDNIKMDLKETRYKYMDWIQLAQIGSCVGLFKDGIEITGYIKRREFLDQLSDYVP